MKDFSSMSLALSQKNKFENIRLKLCLSVCLIQVRIISYTTRCECRSMIPSIKYRNGMVSRDRNNGNNCKQPLRIGRIRAFNGCAGRLFGAATRTLIIKVKSVQNLKFQ